MSVIYEDIYFAFVFYVLLCLFIKFISNLIVLFFLKKSVINKNNSKSLFNLCLKSCLFGIIADAFAIALNIIIVNNFLFNNDYFFIIFGLSMSGLLLFFLDYIFIFKKIDVTLTKKLFYTIVLTLFTISYFFHISFSCTYSLMK